MAKAKSALDNPQTMVDGEAGDPEGFVNGPSVDYSKVSTANPARGQTATPRNLDEQILMQQAELDPTSGRPLAGLTGDPRFQPSEGWQKMEMVHRGSDGSKTTVHYQYNKYTRKAYDIKVVTPERPPAKNPFDDLPKP